MTSFHDLPNCVIEELIASFDVDVLVKMIIGCQDDISAFTRSQIVARLHSSGIDLTPKAVSIVDAPESGQKLVYSALSSIITTLSQAKAPVQLERVELELDLRLKSDVEVLACLADYAKQNANSNQLRATINCQIGTKVSYHMAEQLFRTIGLGLSAANTAYATIDLNRGSCCYEITDVASAQNYLQKNSPSCFLIQSFDANTPTESVYASDTSMHLKFLPAGIKQLTLDNCRIEPGMKARFPKLQSVSLAKSSGWTNLVTKCGPQLTSLELKTLHIDYSKITFGSFSKLQQLTLKGVNLPPRMVYPPSLTKLVIDEWVLFQDLPSTLQHLELHCSVQLDFASVDLRHLVDLHTLKLSYVGGENLDFNEFNCPPSVKILQLSQVNKTFQKFRFPPHLQEFVYLPQHSSWPKSIVVPSGVSERKLVLGSLRRDVSCGH